MEALFPVIQDIEILLKMCETEEDIEPLKQLLREYEATLAEKEFSSTLLSFVRSQWDRLD